MSRKLVKAAAASLCFILFLCAAYGAEKPKPGVFCIGDSIILGNKGTYIYSDILQVLFDKEYGKDKVAVFNYSFFDMNTTQCLRLVTDLLEKQKSTEYIIIMAGEANFYNLNGLTDYLYSIGQYTPETSFIDASDVNALEKLNTGVASMYNSPAAESRKAFVQYAFSRAYRAISGGEPKRVEGYTPKVIPVFHVLTDDISQRMLPASYVTRYRAAWEFINSMRYDEAEKILKEMLETNQLDSNLYYALGSLYLLRSEGKDVNKALQMFQEGILINPFDRSNQCYKGLSVMFMSYDGKITSEILYFARVMKSYLGERIPEINSIVAIGTTDYNEKVSLVSNWVLSDIKKINELCVKNGVQLVVVDYPLDAKVNELLRNAFSLSTILFVNNSSVARGASSDSARVYVDTAKNVMDAINKNKKDNR